MADSPISLAILSVLLLGQAVQGERVTGSPGPPPVSEGAYRFECAGIGGGIRWRQERFDLDRVTALAEALRVTPLELTVGGHGVPAADWERLRQLFRDFAWIEQAWASCDGDHAMISLRVMPLCDWIAYIEDRAAERPRLRLWTIRVSANGIVDIS